MTKALFSDLDGTLLNDDGIITEGNRAAIRALLDAGHQMILATGRPLSSALQQAELLGLNHSGCFLIAFNGGILYDLGASKVLSREALPLPLVRKIFGMAKEMGIHIHTYGEKTVIAEKDCDLAIMQRYCSMINVPEEYIPSIDDLTREPEKCLMIEFKHPEKLEVFRQKLKETYGDQTDSFFSSANYLEIVRHGANKGRALRQMCELLHIDPENSFAAGDAANDIPMLETAHTGFAIHGSSKEVCLRADHTTVRDNNHDAIAEIIENWILS